MTDPVKPTLNKGPFRNLGLEAELTDAQKAANQVRTALDSVTLIDQLIAANVTEQRDLDTISRNVEHLKIVVSRDVVKNSTENLQPLNDAIVAGDAYLAAHTA